MNDDTKQRRTIGGKRRDLYIGDPAGLSFMHMVVVGVSTPISYTDNHLKPCSCGAPCGIVMEQMPYGITMPSQWMVACDGCDVMTDYHDNRSDAVGQWNGR